MEISRIEFRDSASETVKKATKFARTCLAAAEAAPAPPPNAKIGIEIYQYE
jgi:hypothetical protein